MACEIRWYVPDRVMYVQFYDVVTEAEVRQTALKLVEILDYDPRKYLILDAVSVKTYPSLMGIKNAMVSANLRYASTWVVTYGFVQGIAQFLIAVAMQLLQVRFRSLTNLDESLTFLQDIDSTLPPLLPIYAAFEAKSDPHQPLATILE